MSPVEWLPASSPIFSLPNLKNRQSLAPNLPKQTSEKGGVLLIHRNVAMNHLSPQLDEKIISDASSINGWLQPREMRFLALAVLNQTAEGRIVELGSYHGKSTSVLASTIQHTGGEKLISVDPIDPRPLHDNLARLGLQDYVDARHQTSTDFAANWKSPIGFLWHDGANDYATVQQDCRDLFPLLTDRSIVAFHDVLNASGERIHIFDEMVLNSPNFGWVGICGSIGFGQYRATSMATLEQAQVKRKLSKKLARLKPFHHATQPNPKGWQHMKYKAWRSRIAHGPVTEFRAA